MTEAKDIKKCRKNTTVNNWDMQDITILQEIIKENNNINLADLPSAIPVPELITTYPVWSIDMHGRALVGVVADQVEDLSDILEWYAISRKEMQQDYIIRGYESVEKVVGSGNLRSSRVNLPVGWKGKRVRVILLDP